MIASTYTHTHTNSISICVFCFLSVWINLRVSKVAVTQGLCYSDAKRGECGFISMTGLIALRIIVFQALEASLYIFTRLAPTRVFQSNISDSQDWSWQVTAVSDVLVCCMTGFNIPCLLIACRTCVRGVSLRKKTPPYDLLGNNEAISWLKLEKLLRPLASAHSEKCKILHAVPSACEA